MINNRISIAVNGDGIIGKRIADVVFKIPMPYRFHCSNHYGSCVVQGQSRWGPVAGLPAMAVTYLFPLFKAARTSPREWKARTT